METISNSNGTSTSPELVASWIAAMEAKAAEHGEMRVRGAVLRAMGRAGFQLIDGDLDDRGAAYAIFGIAGDVAEELEMGVSAMREADTLHEAIGYLERYYNGGGASMGATCAAVALDVLRGTWPEAARAIDTLAGGCGLYVLDAYDLHLPGGAA